jgi:hypothetical protein
MPPEITPRPWTLPLKTGFAVGHDDKSAAKSLISMVGAQGLEPWTR